MGRRFLTVVFVCLASLGAGAIALSALRLERDLSVGSVKVFVDPGHHGALDLYVPLVDWGVRFRGVRLPVRLRVDVQRIDRDAAVRVAREGTDAPILLSRIKRDATDAIASYLRILVVVVVGSALAFGMLVALALRGLGWPLREGAITAGATALAIGVAMVVLLPPRGDLRSPTYYAHGPDIPRALRAIESAGSTADVLGEELDAQLVGLARLVAPGERSALEGRPQITVASDLHNNLLAIPPLQRIARGSPLFFVGDLTDRGSRLESELTRDVLRAGTRLVFVTGNHDSDSSAQELADRGAIVLTERGRLLRGGRFGPVVVRVAGLRVAGYGDPFRRRRAVGYLSEEATVSPKPSPAQQTVFADWLHGLQDKVDVVMVHEPGLAAKAIADLRRDPPAHPLLLLVGHTHHADILIDRGLTVLNGGTVGAGGTGNLDEAAAGDSTQIGAARLIYATVDGAVAPLAADLVEIDPGSGSATARRYRLDVAETSQARR
jgi:predicted phosphodiesterase